MAQDPQPTTSFFSQIDVPTGAQSPKTQSGNVEALLSEIRDAQDRQNELLEELIHVMGTNQRQRASELAQWKQANPHLAEDCRKAAQTLGRVQAEYLRKLTEEISENGEELVDGEFLMNEFIDRFGPRLPHLHGMLQVLSQLSANDPQADDLP